MISTGWNREYPVKIPVQNQDITLEEPVLRGDQTLAYVSLRNKAQEAPRACQGVLINRTKVP